MCYRDYCERLHGRHYQHMPVSIPVHYLDLTTYIHLSSAQNFQSASSVSHPAFNYHHHMHIACDVPMPDFSLSLPPPPATHAHTHTHSPNELSVHLPVREIRGFGHMKGSNPDQSNDLKIDTCHFLAYQ